MRAESPMFQFWAITLDMELLLLLLVRSLRLGDFPLYIDVLIEMCPWFFSLDHTNYSRWIPGHIKDMIQLENNHRTIHEAFVAGHFTVSKSACSFSSLAVYHAHE
ncbi:unnamed protein product [Owenia fusiformis]|uniref:Uncharacterized protein n=1 Tax=Owenia fusiformis TaxID=6347 RepID=A0A8J1TEW2_OWEFU|nr:unnamed protein product [Owenia fusiformis]